MNKTVVFCLPGSSFSREFVENWSNVLVQLSKAGIRMQASFAYDPNIGYARSKCLQCDTRKGVRQVPFDGKINYDFLMWVDSDVLFSADDVLRLLAHDKDIVCGAYIMSDNRRYPIVMDMDPEYFLQHGHYEFLDRPKMAKLQDHGALVPVAYNGFGFMCVKKGVFESMNYPYFASRMITFKEGVQETTSEDVAWCISARELGYEILLDPLVVVYHQKMIPLR